MLRYRADMKTLLFVAIYFALVGVRSGSTRRRSSWLAIPLLVLTCWFSFFGAVATHNTVHMPGVQAALAQPRLPGACSRSPTGTR